MGKENLIIHIVISLHADGKDFTPPQTSLRADMQYLKNALEEISGRLDDTEEWSSDLEDRIVKVTWA